MRARALGAGVVPARRPRGPRSAAARARPARRLGDGERALVQIVAGRRPRASSGGCSGAARRIRAGVRRAGSAACSTSSRPARRRAAARSNRQPRCARGAREGRAPALPLPSSGVAVAAPPERRARADPRPRRRLRRLRGQGRPAPPPPPCAPHASSRTRALGRRGFLLSIPSWPRSRTCPASGGAARARARRRAQRRPAPRPARDGKPLGLAASGEPVALAVADARYHLHLLGPTGVGKSTLIARLALADLGPAGARSSIDPKGDLVEEILERIPPGSKGGSICSIRSTRPARPERARKAPTTIWSSTSWSGSSAASTSASGGRAPTTSCAPPCSPCSRRAGRDARRRAPAAHRRALARAAAARARGTRSGSSPSGSGTTSSARRPGRRRPGRC